MSKVYKASRKTEGKDGKTYWNPVGFTVFVGYYNGEDSVTLVDDRTGEKYPCFPQGAGSRQTKRSGGDEEYETRKDWPRHVPEETDDPYERRVRGFSEPPY